MNLRTPLLAAALLGAALGGLSLRPSAADASMVVAMDLPRLTARAERIVVGEILSATSSWDAKRRRIYTTIELQVAEMWKGSMPAGGRITFTQLGGSVGDMEMRVHGLPAFRSGERAVLFLAGEGPGTYLVGLGQGRRPLRFDAGNGRWMVDPGDRSAAVVTSAPVAPGTGRRFEAAAPEPALPLDELRSQVRALLR